MWGWGTWTAACERSGDSVLTTRVRTNPKRKGDLKVTPEASNSLKWTWVVTCSARFHSPPHSSLPPAPGEMQRGNEATGRDARWHMPSRRAATSHQAGTPLDGAHRTPGDSLCRAAHGGSLASAGREASRPDCRGKHYGHCAPSEKPHPAGSGVPPPGYLAVGMGTRPQEDTCAPRLVATSFAFATSKIRGDLKRPSTEAQAGRGRVWL